jgi:hypothetical protein
VTADRRFYLRVERGGRNIRELRQQPDWKILEYINGRVAGAAMMGFCWQRETDAATFVKWLEDAALVSRLERKAHLFYVAMACLAVAYDRADLLHCILVHCRDTGIVLFVYEALWVNVAVDHGAVRCLDWLYALAPTTTRSHVVHRCLANRERQEWNTPSARAAVHEWRRKKRRRDTDDAGRPRKRARVASDSLSL